jgi:hypothetical protein
MKKLIYMIGIDHDKSENKHSDFIEYRLKSWKFYCDKHDIDFKHITENDERYGWPVFNKLNVCDEDYDLIGVVDDDTMIKWDAPNIFDIIKPGINGCVEHTNLRYSMNSIEVYKKFFDFEMDLNLYINAGITFLDRESLKVYRELREFYFEHKEELDNWKLGGGREQTLFNYFVQKSDVDLNLLSPSWNLTHIHRKNMFTPNWQLEKKTPHFIKHSNIWHFTGFPVEERKSVMKQTWDVVGKNYE